MKIAAEKLPPSQRTSLGKQLAPENTATSVSPSIAKHGGYGRVSPVEVSERQGYDFDATFRTKPSLSREHSHVTSPSIAKHGGYGRVTPVEMSDRGDTMLTQHSEQNPACRENTATSLPPLYSETRGLWSGNSSGNERQGGSHVGATFRTKPSLSREHGHVTSPPSIAKHGGYGRVTPVEVRDKDTMLTQRSEQNPACP